MPTSGAPQTDLDPWATGNYGAGAFSWSSTARRVATAITGFAAAGLTPNQKTDAQSFNEYIARIQEFIRWARGTTTAGTDGMMSALYGDGSDGDVVVGSSGSLARTMYYRNFTVPNTFAVNTAGHIIFVANTLTIEAGGRISCNGGAASGGTRGSPNATSILLGGEFGANGVSNGAGQVGAPGVGPTARALGGNAGNGGDADGTYTGGAGGAGAPPTANEGGWLDLSASYGRSKSGNAWRGGSGGGSGGTADGNGTSGAGGAGGGIVVIFARRVDNQGQIAAMGGDGGDASDNGTSTEIGGGGGGGGGVIYLIHREAVGGSLGTLDVSGGAGGAAAGTVGATAQDGATGADGLVVTLVG